MPSHTRLSAQDASFLSTESHEVPMVVATVGIYDERPLRQPDGRLDIARLRRHLGATVARVPALRRRLAITPLFRHPVWVDAESVDLDVHICRAALPAPGDDAALMDLAGRLYNQPLPRDRPLWDLWVIEGLSGDRFALLTRLHHALIDGGSGLQLLSAMHTLDPQEPERLPPSWKPRSQPGPADLFVGEIAHRLRGAQRIAESALRGVAHPAQALDAGAALARGLLAAGNHIAAPSPVNVAVGSRRRVQWLRTPLADIKDIRRRLGGTVNDAVLAVMAGALRSFLESAGGGSDDVRLRVACPANRRAPDEKGVTGNHTAGLVVDLPTDLADRHERYRAVVAATRSAKASGQAEAVQFVIDLADSTVPELVHSVMRLSSRFQNLVVSNLPGPPVPIFMLGCRAQALYPLMMLMKNSALGVTVFSYDGQMHWSLSGDWDTFADLAPLVDAVRREIDHFAPDSSADVGQSAL